MASHGSDTFAQGIAAPGPTDQPEFASRLPLCFRDPRLEEEFSAHFQEWLLTNDVITSLVIVPALAYTAFRGTCDLAKGKWAASFTALAYVIVRSTPTVLRLGLGQQRYCQARPAVMAGVHVARVAQVLVVAAVGLQGYSCTNLRDAVLEQVFTMCGTALSFPTLFRHHLPATVAAFVASTILIRTHNGLCMTLLSRAQDKTCSSVAGKLAGIVSRANRAAEMLLSALVPPTLRTAFFAIFSELPIFAHLPSLAAGLPGGALATGAALPPDAAAGAAAAPVPAAALEACRAVLILLLVAAAMLSSAWLLRQELRARAAFLQVRGHELGSDTYAALDAPRFLTSLGLLANAVVCTWLLLAQVLQ